MGRVRVALAALVLLAVCVPWPGSLARAAARDDRLSAWIADWDIARGLAEWRAHPGLFDSVRVFAVAFDGRDRPVLAPAWAAALGGDARSVFGATPAYLTVVNDVVTQTGQGNRLKDPELVRRLVATPRSRQAHAAELLALAARFRFAGIEIDYENVDAATWPDYLAFVAELQAAAGGRGLVVSVVLQPQRRYLTTPLPEGPAYLLMGYNLFGSHSGPGPKATPAFLAEQARALAGLGRLDAAALALATGGFDWTEGGPVRQLTEAEAVALIAGRGLTSRRSAPDGYLVTRYRDEAGLAHEVWHADAVTVATLWQAAREAGFGRLAVWRLGGNTPALFDWLQRSKR